MFLTASLLVGFLVVLPLCNIISLEEEKNRSNIMHLLLLDMCTIEVEKGGIFA